MDSFFLGGGHIWRLRGARAYNGGLGAEPPWGPGAEPLVRGSGGLRDTREIWHGGADLPPTGL